MSEKQDKVEFEGWCIVELMGHQQIAGYVSEKAMFGTALMRVDVPETAERAAYTKFYGGNAIYGITPVEKAVAVAMANAYNEPPINVWQLKKIEQQLPAPAVESAPADDSAMVDYRVHHVTAIECYTSGSGNKTWKALDDDGWIIYLRQSQRAMLEDFGLWSLIDDMEVGDEWECDIFIHTVQDGDFRKPVQFEGVPEVFKPADQPEIKDAAVEPESILSENKQQAIEWAKSLLEKPFVVFDTETTGFGARDEIIQIGVIDQDGNTVLEQLIKPSQSIQNSEYHGITDDTVADAPSFTDVYPAIKQALGDKVVVAYNFDYDSRMLNQACKQHELDTVEFAGQHCAMLQYAAYNDEWDDYHSNWVWQKLREALAAFGLKHKDFGEKEHDACTDARATLAVIKNMAGQAEKPKLPF